MFQAYRNWVQTKHAGKEEPKLPGMDYTPNQLYFLNAAQVGHKYFFINHLLSI